MILPEWFVVCHAVCRSELVVVFLVITVVVDLIKVTEPRERGKLVVNSMKLGSVNLLNLHLHLGRPHRGTRILNVLEHLRTLSCRHPAVVPTPASTRAAFPLRAVSGGYNISSCSSGLHTIANMLLLIFNTRCILINQTRSGEQSLVRVHLIFESKCSRLQPRLEVDE
jgi:hypothetical protein